jgi:Family of unknown function (DUF5578)
MHEIFWSISEQYHRLTQANPKFQMQVFKGLRSLLNSQAISASALQMSSQGLRMLLVNAPTIIMTPTIIDPTANLLRSPHLQIQYEGFELLQELMKRQNMQDLIAVHLIGIMRNVVDDGQDEKEACSLSLKHSPQEEWK